MKKTLDFLWKIALGALLLAIGINGFLVPAKITTGGMGGIGTVLLYFFSVPLYGTVFLGNLILFCFGFRRVKAQGIFKSLLGILFLSLFLFLTQSFPPVTRDLVVAAVFGGVLEGVGVGLTVLGGGSTGGSDFAAVLINKRFPQFSLGNTVLVLDGFVILLSGILFGDATLILYSAASLFISSKAMDFVLVRGEAAKAILVITKKAACLSEKMMNHLQRGVTGLYSRGIFSGEDKMSLLCVVKARQVPKLLRLVKAEDRDAFLVVLDAKRVKGEGFEKME